MTFLPVVQRELLVAARSTSVRAQRFGAAGFGLLVYLIVVLTEKRTPQAIGQSLFISLASVLWVAAWTSGLVSTTDSLTREKREGTLGLLFLTDLRNYDVVLGKLAATALQQVMMLVGALPILAIALALGGVSAGEFWRTVVSLLECQGVSITLGLACSAIATTFAGSLRYTTLTLLMLTLVPVGVFVVLTHGARPVPAGLFSLSPLLHFLTGLETFRISYPTAPQGWQWGARLQLGVIVGCIATACVLVRRYRDRIPSGSDAGLFSSGRLPALTGWRHIHWREWLEANPYYWLARTYQRDPSWIGGCLGVLLGFSAGFAGLTWWEALKPGLRTDFYLLSLGFAYLSHQLLKAAVAFQSTQRLGEDQRSGAMEMLLTTPLSAGELVQGNLSALHAQARPWGLALGAVALAQLLPLIWVEVLEELRGIVLVIFFGQFTLWLNLDWTAHIGLRTSLRVTDPVRAFRSTVLRLLIPGWLAGITLLLVSAGLGLSYGKFYFTYVLAYGAALGLSGWQARRARIDLKFGLRDLAAGLGYDTNARELAEDFRKAAMTWEDRWFTRH